MIDIEPLFAGMSEGLAVRDRKKDRPQSAALTVGNRLLTPRLAATKPHEPRISEV